MNNGPVISVKNVWFSYGDIPVLENVSLDVEPHSFTWIVGPNGGGKTTLARIILGLLKPDRGDVTVFGGPPETARPRIGYMPQYTSLDTRFPVSVNDVVLMGRLGNGFKTGGYGKDDMTRGYQALESVGLMELKDRPFSALSGGQLRRLLIARALASDPEVLMLDEPTANLDMVVAGELHDLLEELSSRMTVVMVSHDPAFVSKSVEQVICVNRTAHKHPTTEIDGPFLGDLYGSDVRMVRHDRHLNGGKNKR
jgi:zinc transport system ATP-binding protein